MIIKHEAFWFLYTLHSIDHALVGVGQSSCFKTSFVSPSDDISFQLFCFRE